MTLVVRLRALALGILLLAGLTGRASADEIAPELAGQQLRQKAESELRRLVAHLDPKDQRRLAGVYVAFAPDASDPSAQAACDDDGDYVVVVNDAMLRLVDAVARAQSYDDANGSRKVEDYATFLARSQLPGRRLLPPPPGFFVAERAADTADERLREALAFVLARELVHMRAGDLVCPKPTATREHGDDVWTPQEQRKAEETARNLYPGRAAERDHEATVRVLDAGRGVGGAQALLRLFVQVEVERTVHASRFAPTFLALHPSASTRLAAVRVSAESHGQDD